MSGWQSGRFERQKISRVWHPWTPAHAFDSLEQIDLHDLWDRGKRLLLLDVDNTLVQWKQENFAQPVLDWIEKAKTLGFGICLVSNTTRVDRLERLKELLGVEVVRGRFKPSRAMFRLAMIKFGVKPDQTIMVGDQLMTDVLGANRAGIDAIWVRKMDGPEFRGTRINRNMERFFQSFIYRALVVPIDEEPGPAELEAEKPVPERTIVQQFIKFSLVGGTSFVIDYMIRMTLTFGIPIEGEPLGDVVGRQLIAKYPALFGFAQLPHDAFWPIAATIAAAFAILNSFIWNRYWTFGIRGKHERLQQLRRFVLVSVIGLFLNVFFSTIFNMILPFSPKNDARVATVLAAGIVAIWNFSGQRLYAFKHK
jgi:uncharacterized protein